MLRTDRPNIGRPLLFNSLLYEGEDPDLGLSHNLSFIYEDEATFRDERSDLRAAGKPDTGASAYTIEFYEDQFIKVIQSRNRYEYIVIDIESLNDYHDPIAVQYVELAKAAAPYSNISWWNTGPEASVEIDIEQRGRFGRAGIRSREMWSALSHRRKQLVDANDFCILGCYFDQSDTFDDWAKRELPRVTEARRLYQSKPMFVTLSPHTFQSGKPWPYVDGDLFGSAIDAMADILVDGIVFWSFEGTGQLQRWNESLSWVGALRARIGVDGRYRSPAS